jgi:iron complex outermembrane receptor protein
MVCTGLLVFLSAAFDVRAQEPAKDSSQLEEIIVVAQKRAEDNQTVPVAVTAFTRTMIENSQQHDVTDLSGMVPNLEISQSGSGPNATLISLRGLSFQDIEKSFEPPIGVVVDGVYLSTSTGQLAQVFDFDHIEVAAGPQGTLFGKNTTGGVINITRSKPDPNGEDFTGKVALTAGNFGEHDAEAVVDKILLPGTLAVKLAAFSQNNDGAYSDPYVKGNLGKRDYQSLSFGVDWRPNDKSDVYLIYDYTNDRSQLSPQISALTPNALPLSVGGFIDGRDAPCLNPNLPNACPNASGQAPSNVATSNKPNNAAYLLNAFTLNSSYDFDAFRLISVSGFRFSVEGVLNDYDATQYTLFDTNRPQTYRQASEELRFESEFKGPFNFVGGLYYFDSNYILKQYSILDFAAVLPIPTGIASSSFGQYTRQFSKTEAVFIQGTYDVTDQLRITLGGRQSWDQKKIAYALYSDPAGSLSQFQTYAPGSGAVLSHGWEEFTPKVGVDYKFTTNMMGYVSYTQGYNSGGFDGRAGSSAGLGPYGPEQVHSYELGLKTSWLNNRLRVNGDVFQAEFYNAQEDVNVAIPNPPYTSNTVTNAANIRYRGAELEVLGKPLPNWTLTTNLGYLHARYTSFYAALLLSPGSTTPVPIDNSSLEVRRTPHFTAGFNSDFTLPYGPGEFGLNTAARYVDSQQFDLLNDPRGAQGPVTKVDASLRYKFGQGRIKWTASVFGKNLSNQTPKNTFVSGYQGSFVEFWTEDIGRIYGARLQADF